MPITTFMETLLGVTLDVFDVGGWHLKNLAQYLIYLRR